MMKKSRLYLVSAIVSILAVRAFAVDYAVDPAFNPTFLFSDFNVDNSIGDVIVQPDGKIVVGGTFTQVNGETSNYIVRLHPDGSRDTSFNSGIIPSTGFLNYVSHVTLLPDGKFLVTGKFKIGTQFSGYVKLNSDGSIDNSITDYAFLSDLNQLLVPLPDGKYLACGGRLINNETYWLAHRLNADGSTDPSFRINVTNASCFDLKVLPDGKILIAGSMNNGSLQRFNPDGSTDSSFIIGTSAPHPLTRKFTVLPDGKILAIYSDSSNGNPGTVRRFNSDGSLDLELPLCGANPPAMLPRSNGNVLMSGCRKWPTSHVFQFAEMRPNGSIEPSLDWINFEGRVNEFRESGNNYYAFGPFTKVNGQTRTKIVRLVPYQAPIKPKFDFDGDGRSDLAVFRPSDRYWYLYQSTQGPRYIQWGLATDKPVAGHYDADEKLDIAIYRDSDAVWHFMASEWGYAWLTLGERGKPMVGDFDGDRKQDWVIRKVHNGGAVSWLVSLNSQHGFGYTTAVIVGEQESDAAVTGDFDGDLREEVGYFRDGVWTTRDFGSGAPSHPFQWGSAGDIPVPADYDGDNQTDYAVFRPSTGVWWINQSSAGVFVARFGLNGDVPVPADYDGDGKVDIAIFRNGQWWQYRSNGGIVHVDQWGVAGDIPIPAQAQ
jgi:uncharacterized delta-60 repeat protein